MLELFGTPAYAATIPLLENIKRVIVNPIIQLLFALSFLYFLYGVVQYIMNAESEKGRMTGASHIGYGLIGMFIIVSVFGIIRLVCNTIGVSC